MFRFDGLAASRMGRRSAALLGLALVLAPRLSMAGERYLVVQAPSLQVRAAEQVTGGYQDLGTMGPELVLGGVGVAAATVGIWRYMPWQPAGTRVGLQAAPGNFSLTGGL